jgi:hypothetical protein
LQAAPNTQYPRSDKIGIGGNIKRQYVDLAEQVFDGLEKAL